MQPALLAEGLLVLLLAGHHVGGDRSVCGLLRAEQCRRRAEVNIVVTRVGKRVFCIVVLCSMASIAVC